MQRITLFIELCLILFLVSGCTIKYNINIDEDFVIEDNLALTVPTAISGTLYPDIKDYFDDMYTHKAKEYGISGYTKKYDVGADFSTIELTSKHNTIETFLNNSPVKALYSNISVQKQGNNTVIKLTGMQDVFGSVVSGDYDTANFTVVLKSKYIIENDNSDERNKLTGEYKWSFSPDTFGKTITLTVTDKINHSAILNQKYSTYVLPVVILAIFVIGYIIYSIFKNKFKSANSV